MRTLLLTATKLPKEMQGMPTVKDVLRRLEFGNSVAEFDEALERYFVETEAFRNLIRDRGDIIAGDKGTGKTALFRIIQKRYSFIDELSNVEVLTGFNPEGTPIFQQLASGEVLEEGQYVTIWKAYILSLVGNWILGSYGGAMTSNMERLEDLLKDMGLRTKDGKASTIFKRLINLYRKLTDVEQTEVAASITPEGIPLVSARVEFGDGMEEVREIPHGEALGLLNDVLTESELRAWIVLDRLDEAFQGYRDVEIPALRALLRTFLDLQEFHGMRLKLFVRKDLFRKIIAGGFVNLTHVNARKIDIIWDDEDLLALVGRRIADNPRFLAEVGAEPEESAVELLYRVFPQQIDVGERKPTTVNWLLSRIRDGNNVKAPRNLIDLVKKSQDAQLRREDREPRDFEEGESLILADAVKRGLRALSQARVEDTLLAEAGEELATVIERFRDGKAEHDAETLASVTGLSGDELRRVTRELVEIGFLEAVGENYKVPMIYRDGLGVTQGKAFD